MVSRDPQTGQFVSGGGSSGDSYHETRLIGGYVASEIAAADLGGGTVEETAEASNLLELIDFSTILTQNEVFEVIALDLSAIAMAHTTATAEGHVEVGYEVSRSNDLQYMGSAVPFVNGGSDVPGTTIQARNYSTEADEVLTIGRLAGEPSMADSASGLAGGSDYDTERRLIPFRSLYGSGPMFDQDDEIWVPHEIVADNVSDHAVQFQLWAGLRGQVHELD